MVLLIKPSSHSVQVNGKTEVHITCHSGAGKGSSYTSTNMWNAVIIHPHIRVTTYFRLWQANERRRRNGKKNRSTMITIINTRLTLKRKTKKYPEKTRFQARQKNEKRSLWVLRTQNWILFLVLHIGERPISYRKSLFYLCLRKSIFFFFSSCIWWSLSFSWRNCAPQFWHLRIGVLCSSFECLISCFWLLNAPRHISHRFFLWKSKKSIPIHY